jgi:hypothetical protein
MILMNLEEITALEEEWLNKDKTLRSEWYQKQPKNRPNPGSDEEWGMMYIETGICDAWGRIFNAYVDLAREGDIEALKRAIFLVWIESTEPPQVSWIWDLDEERVKEVLCLANTMAKEGRLDAELQWMLPWYSHITHYLCQFEDLDDIVKASKGDPFAYYEGCLKSSFDNRGQLGRYWRDLRDDLEARKRRGEKIVKPPPDWDGYSFYGGY